jgi:hypothetical protein
MPKRPSKSTLIKKLDKLFSECVRSVGKCEWCGKREQLQCCHIYSRRYRHTRWDTLNAVCLCAGCHFKAHQNPIDFTKWVEKYLGVGTLDELRQKAHLIKNLTVDEMLELYETLSVYKQGLI